MNNREQNLMPGGVPKWIRCYDSGPDFTDRYTIVFTKKSVCRDRPYWFLYLGTSESTAVSGYGESEGCCIDRPRYAHLGKRIEFSALSDAVKTLVIQGYKDLWDL